MINPKKELLLNRKRRALFRSQHRGMKENDFLLGGYALKNLSSMNEADLCRFEALLKINDNDLFAWIMGKLPIPDNADRDLITAIKNFRDQI